MRNYFCSANTANRGDGVSVRRINERPCFYQIKTGAFCYMINFKKKFVQNCGRNSGRVTRLLQNYLKKSHKTGGY